MKIIMTIRDPSDKNIEDDHLYNDDQFDCEPLIGPRVIICAY